MRETESLLITAQNNARRISYTEEKIDNIQQDNMDRLCGDRN